jgi:flagellar basal body-associated protein FliL
VQNTRSKVIHSVHVLILVVCYYYRMEADYDEVSSNQFLAPAYIQLIVIGVVVILSAVWITYEFFKKVQQRLCRSKKEEDPNEGQEKEENEAEVVRA